MANAENTSQNDGEVTVKTDAQPRQKAGNTVNPQEFATEGWASRLTIFVVAFLVIECITGLWIFLAPFSIAAQTQVILHTLIGLILLVPYFYYQIRHFLVWYRQKFTAAMVLGYILMVMVMVCLVSGVVVTWQAIYGLKLSKTWDMVHLVTGITSTVTIVLHLAMAFLRRRPAIRRVPEFAMALRRFALEGFAYVGVSFAIVIMVAVSWPTQQIEMPLPEGYTLPSYLQQFDEYRGSPFAPTYARTESGTLINPDVLSNSESCGTAGCHDQILAEWQPSAHRFSAINPPFQQVQKNFAKDRSPADTRYCAGCHDPISLFAGAKDIQNMDLSAPGMQEGTSCVVCHSISSVDQRGNADYVLTPPQKYIWEASEGSKKFLSDFLIRAYPRQHLADYDRNLLRTPEFCGTCHKQFIPEALNRFGLSPGQNQYDEWRKSHWHVDEPNKDLSCRDCHMRLVYNSNDPGQGEDGDVRRSVSDGSHRHHGTIATNLFMPAVLKLPHWETQYELTREWIQGRTEISEIKDLWPSGPVASVHINSPEEVETGVEVSLMVLVKNRKAGHNLTTGPLDFMRSWIHLRIADVKGNTIAEWGDIDPETRSINDIPGRTHEIGNARDEGTLVLEGLPLDSEGNPLLKHELWKKAGGKGQRVIFPGYTDKQTYRFKVPPSTEGPITVTADLNFRRYRQEFLELVLPTLEEESGVYQPTITKNSVSREIAVVVD
ncbi:MAG: cytochrome b/b6 domain-containing protein [Candidatus Latescibacteria bacterium]|jgi:hypothetical protein|nr:cytochrome b/b6 domain-containing protein [Candidatus Latescibacterota bacterium]MDP7235936.1 cytochrome b/b6 domain-containing protein [Candidatus Latescibacterota bacterium]